MECDGLLRRLVDEYRAVNGTYIEVLKRPPTALEFSRLVNISRPVVIEGVDLPAFKRWTLEYITQKTRDSSVSVAVTPDGRADAIHCGPDGTLYFVEPCVEKMSIKELLEVIESTTPEAYYLQSQNGNLYSGDFLSEGSPGGIDSASEFIELQPDVPSEISWCSEALGKSPEAVNIWIGNNKSRTSIHCDPYENIYSVVRGAKKFTLIPPTDGWCLKECHYPHAQFSRPAPGAPFEIVPSSPDVPKVRWSSLPDRRLDEVLPREVQPIHVEVKAGQTLYLPVGWWHQVEQSEETTIALNWWYDAETRGLTWALLSSLREVVDVPDGNASNV
ncbi:cupin-like domain-containing protein [Coprinopsis sp. MPI-PUGE-AT-0042]|nr:cupin-like domain-containing protein [Coprinopsis sp. MPI-PUGE-AT-0042]